MACRERPSKEPEPARALLRQWRLPLAALLILVALPGGSSDVEVRAGGGRVTVRVRAAPLADVLERLARETGFELVFEGRRPTQLVTANLELMPEAEALSRLFEGLGVDYAFYADPAGQHVRKLFVQGTSAAEASPVAPSRGGRPDRSAATRLVPPVEPEEPFPAEEPGDLQEPAAEPVEAPPTGQADVSEAPSTAPHHSGLPPMPGGFSMPPTGPAESSVPFPAPAFPGGASMPSAVRPPGLPPPAFPGDASTPN